jgi:hypothetical protein
VSEGEIVVWINGTSDKACGRCDGTESVLDVSFRDKHFKGSLCLTCLHEKVQKASARAKEVGGEDRQPARGAA